MMSVRCLTCTCCDVDSLPLAFVLRDDVVGDFWRVSLASATPFQAGQLLYRYPVAITLADHKLFMFGHCHGADTTVAFW